MRPAGGRGPAQMPPRGDGHHARDRAASGGSRGPARALPRPGPHAPNLRRATGRCGREKREEREEMSCEQRLMLGQMGQRPPFYAPLASVLLALALPAG